MNKIMRFYKETTNMIAEIKFSVKVMKKFFWKTKSVM